MSATNKAGDHEGGHYVSQWTMIRLKEAMRVPRRGGLAPSWRCLCRPSLDPRSADFALVEHHSLSPSDKILRLDPRGTV